MAKNWYVKILFLLISLVGVIWAMTAIKSGFGSADSNSPVQILLGGESETQQPIPAKIIKEAPESSPTPANR